MGVGLEFFQGLALDVGGGEGSLWSSDAVAGDYVSVAAADQTVEIVLGWLLLEFGWGS